MKTETSIRGRGNLDLAISNFSFEFILFFEGVQ